MKKLFITVISILLFSFVSAQTRSDSEIKRDFEKGFKSLMKDLRSADSTTIGGVKDKVHAFENEYQQYKDFLNKAVFPDGYDGTIERLEDQLKESIELANSQARIAELEARISELSGQVDALSKENQALLAELKDLKNEVKELTAKVKQLQDNIAKRDAVVFALVDSLFVQYDQQKLSSGDMKKLSSLEKNKVVDNIKRSINENMAFLSSTGLSGLDFPKMLDEQRKFESSWKGVGKKLAEAYVSQKDRSKEIAAVDTMLGQWRGQVDAAFWKSLNQLFADENLTITPFTNGDEFYKNVVRFIEEQTANADNKSSEQQLAVYEAFAYKTWGSKVKPVWVPVMKRHGLFTDEQTNDIDAKTQLWYAKVKPGNTMLFVLAGALVLAILVGLYLGMKKRPAATE
ncbi:MAG: hypothetical protein PHP62_05810 [Candidatus Moranbacteria bacterium]|nr:hypothetical protein [Candidatus Moranbacteria bacterium]